MKELIITGKENLNKYFGDDADTLLEIEKGNIYGIELIVDTEKKTACYTFVSEFFLERHIRRGISIDDSYTVALTTLIEYAEGKYENIRDEIFLVRSGGDLSKLCNYRTEFDETFDFFFDDAELRKKYNAWDYEENCINADICNRGLLGHFDDFDKLRFLEYIEKRIDILQEYIDGMGE